MPKKDRAARRQADYPTALGRLATRLRGTVCTDGVVLYEGEHREGPGWQFTIDPVTTWWRVHSPYKRDIYGGRGWPSFVRACETFDHNHGRGLPWHGLEDGLTP